MKKNNREAHVNRVASLLAIERDSERVAQYCKTQLGANDAQAKKLIQEARARLALAADVDVREELGRRKEQLEDVRERAREAGDLRVELAAIQELAKLCDLYKTSNVLDAASEAEGAAVVLARKHLEGIGVAPDGLPIEELARLVAGAFLDYEGSAVRESKGTSKRGKRASQSRGA